MFVYLDSWYWLASSPMALAIGEMSDMLLRDCDTPVTLLSYGGFSLDWKLISDGSSTSLCGERASPAKGSPSTRAGFLPLSSGILRSISGRSRSMASR